MKRTKFLSGMLAMALVFGMTMVGCDTGSGGGGGSSGSGSGSGGGGGGSETERRTYTSEDGSSTSLVLTVPAGANAALQPGEVFKYTLYVDDKAISSGTVTIGAESWVFTASSGEFTFTATFDDGGLAFSGKINDAVSGSDIKPVVNVPPPTVPGIGGDSGSNNTGTTGQLTVRVGIGGVNNNIGVVNNNIGGPVWTIFPGTASEPGPFTKYEVSFAATEGGAAHAPVQATYADLSSGKTINDIVVGTYTVTVTAFTGSGSFTAVAEGSQVGVVVSEGSSPSVDILIGPKTGGATGTFSYNITFPVAPSSTLTSYGFLYIRQNDTTISNGMIQLSGGQANSSTRALAPGAYRVDLQMGLGEQSAGFTEVIHIYSGLTTDITKTFTAADFTGNKMVTDANLTGRFAAPQAGATPAASFTDGEQYTGTISWAPAVSTFAAQTATVTLTAKTGWSFSGVGANVFSYAGAASVSNSAYSSSTPFTVIVVFPAIGFQQNGITAGFGYDTAIVEEDVSSDITVSNSSSFTLTAKAEYSDIEWYIDGSSARTGRTLTLLSSISLAAYKRPGTHLLTVVGTKRDWQYSQEIPYTVVEE